MMKLSVSTTKQEQYLGWFYFVFQMLILPDLILIFAGLMGIQLSGTTLNLLFFIINFLCAALIFRKFLQKSAKVTFEAPLRLLKAVGIGYALYWFLNFLVVYFILMLTPQYQNANDANIQVMVHENFVPIAVGTILLAPVAEELVFRGLIFQGLHNRSRLLAYTVSSCAFCLVHLVNYIGYISPLHFLIGFVQYLPAGIAFGYAYEKADSIYAPIVIHMINNTIGIFAMR